MYFLKYLHMYAIFVLCVYRNNYYNLSKINTIMFIMLAITSLIV